jgi:hypothetical protein
VVVGTGVGQSPGPTLSITIFITLIRKGEAEAVKLCTILLVLDVTTQMQVLLHLEQ